MDQQAQSGVNIDLNIFFETDPSCGCSASIAAHLCFNITEKGYMIVPDLYNMIFEYTRKYGKNNVFQ